jgi:hypothetical protein
MLTKEELEKLMKSKEWETVPQILIHTIDAIEGDYHGLTLITMLGTTVTNLEVRLYHGKFDANAKREAPIAKFEISGNAPTQIGNLLGIKSFTTVMEQIKSKQSPNE